MERMDVNIIEFIRDNPILWDKTHGDYKKLQRKEKKWVEIARIIGVSVLSVKKKWKAIRDRHFRILKENLASGSDENTTLKKYKYGDMLQFLSDGTVVNQKTVSNYSEDDCVHKLNMFTEFNGSSDKIFLRKPKTERKYTTKNKNLKITKNQQLNKPQQISYQKDSSQIFGDFVADTLRGLSEPHRKLLRIKLHRSILEIEEAEVNDFGYQIYENVKEENSMNESENNEHVA